MMDLHGLAATASRVMLKTTMSLRARQAPGDVKLY